MDDDPRERAYRELCRRMAGLRDHDPAKLRFFLLRWGSRFIHVSVEVGGLAWSDVEPLWQRWQGIADGCPPPRPSGERRRARHGRSHRGGRGGRGRRRGGWWRDPPFPLPE